MSVGAIVAGALALGVAIAGCMHASELKIAELTSPDPAVPLAWMRVLRSDSFWMQMRQGPDGTFLGSSSWTTWKETLDVCRVDAGGGLACDPTVQLASASIPSGSPDTPRRKAPFEHRKTPRLGDGGAVELVED